MIHYLLTTNSTLSKNFNNTVNDELKNKITLIAGSLIKTENIPGEEDCDSYMHYCTTYDRDVLSV